MPTTIRTMIMWPHPRTALTYMRRRIDALTWFNPSIGQGRLPRDQTEGQAGSCWKGIAW